MTAITLVDEDVEGLELRPDLAQSLHVHALDALSRRLLTGWLTWGHLLFFIGGVGLGRCLCALDRLCLFFFRLFLQLSLLEMAPHFLLQL